MKEKVEAVTLEHQEVKWLEWPPYKYGGRPGQPVEHQASDCQVVVKGSTATVALPNGKSFRKRLSTAGFEFGDKLAKSEIEVSVVAARDDLSKMSVAELKAWGEGHGACDGKIFVSFKRALEKVGIDYDAKRDHEQEERERLLAEAAHFEVTLYSDFKSSKDRFAIVDRNEDPVWYGRSFDAYEQSAGELDAASKAIWLVGKVREALKEEAIALNLFVDAQWLTSFCNRNSKAYPLLLAARKHNVVLTIEWIPGKENPADEWTVAHGYQKWSEVDLVSLARRMEVAA